MLIYDSAVSGNCYKVRLLLTKLGLPFEKLKDGGGRSVRLTDRVAQRQPLSDRIHETRQGRHQHEQRRG